MSRTYLITLFLLVTCFLGGMVYLHFHLVDQQLAAQSAQASPVLALAMERSQERMNMVVWELQARLEDDSKAKFRPILPTIESISETQESLLQEIQELKEKVDIGLGSEIIETPLRNLLEQDRLARKEIVYIMSKFLEDFGEQMDLNRREIFEKKEFYRKEIVTTSFHFSGCENQVVLQNELDLLKLSVLNLQEFLVQDLAQISGGRTLNCFFGPKYYPVVSAGFLNAVVGRSHEARISVGNFATELKPENIRIVIEGDTLLLNEAGWIDFSLIPKKRGEQALEMELLITNPLTGEVISSESSYGYYAY
ncbi:MAG: hypothetical protein AAGA31_06535 [Bacteroidota bacterium]